MSLGSSAISMTNDGGITWSRRDRNSYNTISSLQDVDFVSEDTGWVVGSKGVIGYTSDGGENWVQQKSGTTKLLRSVKFIDSFEGWSVGDNSGILHTEDGGVNWEILDISTVDNLQEVDFLNKNFGYVVGHSSSNISVRIALKTTDGGETWSNVTPNNYRTFDGIEIIDEHRSFLTSSWGSKGVKNILYFTSDGGESWIERLATDPGGLSGSDTMFVTITPINDAPQLAALPDVSFNEDEYKTGYFYKWYDYVYDVDNPDSLMVWSLLKDDSDSIRFSASDDSVRFYAPQDWFAVGKDTLSFIVSDGEYTATADLAVHVLPVNDPPVLKVLPDSISFPSDSSYILSLKDMAVGIDDPDSHIIVRLTYVLSGGQQ